MRIAFDRVLRTAGTARLIWCEFRAFSTASHGHRGSGGHCTRPQSGEVFAADPYRSAGSGDVGSTRRGWRTTARTTGGRHPCRDGRGRIAPRCSAAPMAVKWRCCPRRCIRPASMRSSWNFTGCRGYFERPTTRSDKTLPTRSNSCWTHDDGAISMTRGGPVAASAEPSLRPHVPADVGAAGTGERQSSGRGSSRCRADKMTYGLSFPSSRPRALVLLAEDDLETAVHRSSSLITFRTRAACPVSRHKMRFTWARTPPRWVR